MNKDFLGQELIFIISQPRSGSTLLQRVLSGHPEVQTSAETWLMLHPLYALKREGIETEFNHEWAQKGVSDFLTHYTDGEEVYIRGLRSWAREIYGNALDRSGKRYFLDKTPRYFFVIPELLRVFPKAKFVFLLRNPLAVLASELKTYVNGKWENLAPFAPDVRQAPGLILSGMNSLQSGAIQVRYESFVSQPMAQLKALCEDLEIPFFPDMLEYSNTPAPKGFMNDPVGIHKHKTPSTESVEKWRWMLDDPQASYFAESLLVDIGPDTINGLGYPYQELRALFTERNRKLDRGLRLFPWKLAISDPSQWSYRERAQAARYYACKKHGGLKGELRGFKRALRIAKNDLQTQLARK